MKVMALIVLLFSGMLLIKPIDVSAHGKDTRGGVMDAQMKKLHAMMPMLSVASAELESSLEKGDSSAAKIQADKILTAVPDLKKSKPHKNIKQRKKFVELASNLDETVTSTVELIQKNDLLGAKVAFKKVEEVCAACHAKFRD
ncbi:MAG: cytochrome c [Desulfuromonadaceae bacterium]